jgi:enoyl-CoA hydratase/carnithine racemase
VVNRVVEDSDDLGSTAVALASRIAERAPLSIRAIKGEMAALTVARSSTGHDVQRLAELRGAAWTSRDYQEGVQAFLEKRPARFEGR